MKNEASINEILKDLQGFSFRTLFSLRFHQLRDERGMSQQAFADFLGISRPTVGFYENADKEHGRIPDADTLRIICEKCDVSADYLLGISNTKSPKTEIQAICSYTGLDEKTIENLHCEALGAVTNSALCEVLGCDFSTYHRLIWTITQAIKYSKKAPSLYSGIIHPSLCDIPEETRSEIFGLLEKAGGKYLEPYEARDFYSSQAARILQEIINQIGNQKINSPLDDSGNVTGDIEIEDTDDGEHTED